MKNILTLSLMIISFNLFASNDLINQIDVKSHDEMSGMKFLKPDTVCFTILTDYDDNGEVAGTTVQTWNTIGDLNCEESFGLLLMIWVEMNS